ncbi:DUF308 domain-containing protein [Nostoc sp. UHCC 0302]|uniref:DUF308 domain-containing protein n=1 Tax=Nostoc sp. UHCC 0302 TaxID=3134896 RepID=UPI00311CD3B0
MVMIVLGMIAIAFPFFASVTSVLVFGWIFVFAGIAQIIYANNPKVQLKWLFLPLHLLNSIQQVLGNILRRLA